MQNIKIVRLNSGEELLCEYEIISETEAKLTDAAILIPTRENSIGLMPFMAYAEPTPLVIKTSFIPFVADPVEGLKLQYQQMFGKIITQSKKIVL